MEILRRQNCHRFQSDTRRLSIEELGLHVLRSGIGDLFLGVLTLIVLSLCPTAAFAADGDHPGIGRLLRVLGAALVGTFVLSRIHPVLGILGAIGGLLWLVRILG